MSKATILTKDKEWFHNSADSIRNTNITIHLLPEDAEIVFEDETLMTTQTMPPLIISKEEIDDRPY